MRTAWLCLIAAVLFVLTIIVVWRDWGNGPSYLFIALCLVLQSVGVVIALVNAAVKNKRPTELNDFLD